MMKIIAIVVLSILFGTFCKAQKMAVTDTGEEVLLYSDGTWKYVSATDSLSAAIETNPNTFEKSENSTFLLKSKILNVGFWLNPKKWSFTKPADNEDAEYEFQLKGEDLYGILITEKTEIKLEAFKEIALINAKAGAPDIQVIKEEYRKVNGERVLLLQMNGTISGMNITYYGYYYSNENGSAQFLTYTSQNLFDDYLEEMEIMLNGFVILE